MGQHDEMADLTASEIRRRIGLQELSPVEVMEACLERVQRCNPVINAVCTQSEQALDEARRAEQSVVRGEELGLLHGLPVGIKDVTPTAGLRTTFGSPLYADYVPQEDALVVCRLKAAGAIVLGKTNVPEFAAGGNTHNEVFGPTRNPWNPKLSAGGSTGGGAAALATGMIALAEGTDLGGSLRIPAAFCGVVGLRPSPGLVPTCPSNFPWDTLDVTGPMARTAEQELLSSSVLMLESYRNLVRLTRLGQLNAVDFTKCVEQMEADRDLFLLRDLSLDLCLSRDIPTISTPRSLDLAHLRTALWFHRQRPLTRFISLDQRQTHSARELGLPVDRRA